MAAFKDGNGNYHRVDYGHNHFINGKCVNPKRLDEALIGQTANKYKLVPAKVEITGHVPVFSYGTKTETTKVIHVNTGEKAW